MHREAEKALKEVRRIRCSLANSNFTSVVTGKIEDGFPSQGTKFRAIASRFPSCHFIRFYFWALEILESPQFSKYVFLAP